MRKISSREYFTEEQLLKELQKGLSDLEYLASDDERDDSSIKKLYNIQRRKMNVMKNNKRIKRRRRNS